MSTKVFEAYRLKRGVDLWGFIARVRSQSIEIASESIEKTHRAFLKDPKFRAAIAAKASLSAAKHAGNKAKAKKFYLHIEAWWKIQSLYEDATKSKIKHPFDYDVSLSLWCHRGRVYAIPYRYVPAFKAFGGKDPLGFLVGDPDLEPYAYWNNTDRPRDIDAREWGRRRDAWDAICDRWDDRLTLEILRVESLHKIHSYLSVLDQKGEKKNRQGRPPGKPSG